MDIIDHGPAGIGGISRVGLAASEHPNEPCVHRAKSKFACFGTSAGVRDRVEQIGDFAGREIRVEQKSCLGGDHLFMTCIFELAAKFSSAPVLPNQRPVDGLTCLAIPDDGGFTLIGDADTSDIFRGKIGFIYDGASGGDGGIGDVLRVMFNKT